MIRPICSLYGTIARAGFRGLTVLPNQPQIKSRCAPVVRFGSLADTQRPENCRMAELRLRMRPRVSAYGQKRTFTFAGSASAASELLALVKFAL